MFFSNSSGTTWQPEGVVHTDRTLIDRAQSRCGLRQACHGRRGSTGLSAAGLIGRVVNIFAHAQRLVCAMW
jgi:acyl-CoA synthetase (AMP-forming)/AMP-acid ligase II